MAGIVYRRLTIAPRRVLGKQKGRASRNLTTRTASNMLSVTTIMPSATSAAPSPLLRDAEALQRAVADLVRVYQFRDRDRICCHDVSVTQCHALEALVEQGPLRLGGLAERLFLDKSTTSRVVAVLVRKGYVEQGPDPADGRATILAATRRARALHARITSELVEQQRQVLADLDPAVRAGVVDVVRRLARAADARFRSGVSVGTCRAPAPEGAAAGE
jgi:DNA-binding MarR family transcriptional regulator